MIIPKELLEKMKKAKHVAALTGAGVSAESGISTFRDPDGLWAKFNPMELASVDGFMSNPKLVLEWYKYRVDMVNENKPNPGHLALAKMQDMFPKFTLITQNVDRLHHRAGSKNVIELHGDIITNRCFECSRPFDGEALISENELATCPECGGKIRPNVVWFGEMLPADAIEYANAAADVCDIFFSIGTSAEVYPAANLPIVAKRQGAYLVEVNPNQTVLSSYADAILDEPSGVALPELLKQFEEYK